MRRSILSVPRSAGHLVLLALLVAGCAFPDPSAPDRTPESGETPSTAPVSLAAGAAAVPEGMRSCYGLSLIHI